MREECPLDRAKQRLCYTISMANAKARQGLHRGRAYVYAQSKTWMAERRLREATQHRGQRVVARLRASGWWELAAQPWLFWVGVGALLLVVIGVVWGMAVGLLSVRPALIFFVALGLLVARIHYPLGGSLGYRIFEVLFWLAASYIPGYIIFALVTDLPRNQDLKQIRPFLATQTAMLAGDGQAVLMELKKAARYEGADPPTKEDFVEICKRINPSGPAPLLRSVRPLEYANWIEFLLDRRHRSARAIEKLFRYMTFLDSEHIHLITKIDNSFLFGHLDTLNPRGIGNTDIAFLAEELFIYYRLTRQLQQYADRHLKGLAWSEPRD